LIEKFEIGLFVPRNSSDIRNRTEEPNRTEPKIFGYLGQPKIFSRVKKLLRISGGVHISEFVDIRGLISGDKRGLN